MAERYSILEKASLVKQFLRSNAKQWGVFSAIAELVDNSRDANAKKFKIFGMELPNIFGDWCICFLDDGEGMNPSECNDVIKFGKSKKRSENSYVGRNGVGLKSATFSLAKDFILFTKQNNIYTIIFISETFFNSIKCDEIIVAIPSFTRDRRPHYDIKRFNANKDVAVKKHELEMELIYQYSPFTNLDALFEQFNKIESSSGTLIICYNLWLNPLTKKADFMIDPITKDLVLSGDRIDNSDINDLPLQRRSFNEYVSILYTDPRMKIYIENKKVRTKKLFYTLYCPIEYEHTAKNIFKTKAENDIKNLQDELEKYKSRLREAETKEIDFQRRFVNLLDKNAQVELRSLQSDRVYIQSLVDETKAKIENIEKKSKESQTITLRFGLNIHDPSKSGVLIYNGCRLISTPDRLTKNFDQFIESNGVVAIVIIPYSVMEPTNQKSELLNSSEKELLKLNKVIEEHLHQYLKDFKRKGPRNFDHLLELWDYFGYNKYLQPNFDAKLEITQKKRFTYTKTLVQCDSCLKWRVMPCVSFFFTYKFPDNWCCADVQETQTNCNDPEKTVEIIKGKLLKEPRPTQQNQQRRLSVSSTISNIPPPRRPSSVRSSVEHIRNPLSLFNKSKPTSSQVSNSSIEFSRPDSILKASSSQNQTFVSVSCSSNVTSTSDNHDSSNSRVLSYTEFLQSKKASESNKRTLSRNDSSDFEDEASGFLFVDPPGNQPTTSQVNQQELQRNDSVINVSSSMDANSLDKKKKRSRTDISMAYGVDRDYVPPPYIVSQCNQTLHRNSDGRTSSSSNGDELNTSSESTSARLPITCPKNLSQNTNFTKHFNVIDSIINTDDNFEIVSENDLEYDIDASADRTKLIVDRFFDSLTYMLDNLTPEGGSNFSNYTVEQLYDFDIKGRFDESLDWLRNKYKEKIDKKDQLIQQLQKENAALKNNLETR